MNRYLPFLIANLVLTASYSSLVHADFDYIKTDGCLVYFVLHNVYNNNYRWVNLRRVAAIEAERLTGLEPVSSQIYFYDGGQRFGANLDALAFKEVISSFERCAQ